MGFYLRKSVSVGPFRFNLSGSGVGISAGVRGLRVGTGPRGNYVRIGRGGVYYQHTFAGQPPSSVPHQPPPPRSLDFAHDDLVDEIRAKQRLFAFTPLAIALALILLFIAMSSGSGWIFLFALMLTVAAIVYASYKDSIRKTVVVLYELEPPAEQAFERFHEWASALSATKRAWRIGMSMTVGDRKYHAGANSLVERQPLRLRNAAPPRIRTNVPVLSIGTPQQTMYFLPDRLLIYDRGGVGAVPYRSLDISVSQQTFIERSGVASDATIIGYTWTYVNRNGGPDRRFNVNPQIPICAYDELRFHTASGWNEVLQVSRAGIGEGFAAAVRHLGSVVS